MFTVSNRAGVIIARFRTLEQIHLWAERVGIIMANVNISWRTDLLSANEWTREDYR